MLRKKDIDKKMSQSHDMSKDEEFEIKAWMFRLATKNPGRNVIILAVMFWAFFLAMVALLKV